MRINHVLPGQPWLMIVLIATPPGDPRPLFSLSRQRGFSMSSLTLHLVQNHGILRRPNRPQFAWQTAKGRWAYHQPSFVDAYIMGNACNLRVL